jgi:hypothetical protein
MPEQPTNSDNYTTELNSQRPKEVEPPKPAPPDKSPPTTSAERSNGKALGILSMLVLSLIGTGIFLFAGYEQIQTREEIQYLVDHGSFVEGTITDMTQAPVLSEDGHDTGRMKVWFSYVYRVEQVRYSGGYSALLVRTEMRGLRLNNDRPVMRDWFEVGDSIAITVDSQHPTKHRVGQITAKDLPSSPWCYGAPALVSGLLACFFVFLMIRS